MKAHFSLSEFYAAIDRAKVKIQHITYFENHCPSARKYMLNEVCIGLQQTPPFHMHELLYICHRLQLH
jgi:hypothetical protein